MTTASCGLPAALLAALHLAACASAPLPAKRSSLPEVQVAAHDLESNKPNHAQPGRERRDCLTTSAVAMRDSYWFIVTTNLNDLAGLIRRMDAPGALRPSIEEPCPSRKGACADWGFYVAPEAWWHYAAVGGKVVATRQT